MFNAHYKIVQVQFKLLNGMDLHSVSLLLELRQNLATLNIQVVRSECRKSVPHACRIYFGQDN